MRFPVPRLRPAGGFRVEPATGVRAGPHRIEFRRRIWCRSAGARGLLQIMPETASFVIGAPTSSACARCTIPASISTSASATSHTWPAMSG